MKENTDEIKTVLTRHNSFLRTLYAVTNKGILCELDKICVYDENGVIISQNFGYFDNDEELSIKQEVVLRRKINFERKENFVVKAEDSFYNRYCLYIYVENVDLQKKGLVKDYFSVYRVYTINGIEVKVRLKYLNEQKDRARNLFDIAVRSLNNLTLPIAENELSKICNDLQKYNSLYIEESKKIDNYIPKEEDFI